ncbi:MAG: replicative DNA helicase [Betaproteobacteria bacterium]|nr:replicative DNA helicase [Betaproteobacteria bacterium]
MEADIVSDQDVAAELMPHSAEAERIVIGVLLADNAKFDELPDGGLSHDDFYLARHQLIYQHIDMLYNKHNTVADMATVAESLAGVDKLAEIGGREYLLDMQQQADFYPHFAQYARTVREIAVLRRLIEETRAIRDLAQQRRDNAANRSEDRQKILSVDEIVDKAEQKVSELASKFRDHRDASLLEISKIVRDVHKNLEIIQQRVKEKKLPYTGLITGHSLLDYYCAGLQPGELIILGARPSVGKTAFSLDLVRRICSKPDEEGRQRWVGFFSLEMSASQLAMRIMSSVSRISSHAMRTGQLAAPEWDRFMQADEEVSKWGLQIDESSMLTVNDLRSRSRRIKRMAENTGGTLSMIIVDYLQLMIGSDRDRQENRTLEVSSISRGLKSLARELQVPVLALAQLSRSVEQRSKRIPQLSDLRESGAIEQDADQVIFLERTSEIDKNEPRAEDHGPESITMFIRKNRNGPVGKILFEFRKSANRFDQHRDQETADSDFQAGDAAGDHVDPYSS